MPLFPLFVNLEDKNCIIFGGGKVAARKIKLLTVFTKKITIVSIIRLNLLKQC